MADNFLERRMEDMLNGKLAASVRSKKSRGVCSVPKSAVSHRVLIAGLPENIIEALGLAFIRKGHKAACFYTSPLEKQNPAFRNYNTSSDKDVIKSFTDLCSVRLDLDIIVCGAGLLPAITDCWVMHRNELPLPNPFGGRLIYVGEYEAEKSCDLSQWHITMTQLICPKLFKDGDKGKFTEKDTNAILEALSATVLFLSSREARYVSGLLSVD